MITIPTSELTDLLSEVVQFAAQDKDDFWHGVLLQWDGEALHASAYDTLSGARITWIPGEGAEAELDLDEDSGAMHTDLGWGGADDPWSVFISVPSAKEIVKTFKLPAKHRLVPVTLDASVRRTSLVAERTRETGQSHHLGMWPGDPDKAAKFPAIDVIVSKARAQGAQMELGVHAAPRRLAAFAAAARHGVIEILHCRTPHPLTIQAGDTFTGFLYPQQVTSAAASATNLSAQEAVGSRG